MKLAALRSLTSASIVVAACLAALSCGDESAGGDSPFFPKWEPGDVVPSGEVRGTLAIEEGCVFLTTDGGTSFLPIWPDSLDFDASAGAVVSEDGIQLRTGEQVGLGGGERGFDQAEESMEASIPDQCRVGKAWMVTRVL